MRYLMWLALSMPLAAAAPPGPQPDNAVTAEKQRFEEMRSHRFPLWPRKNPSTKPATVNPLLRQREKKEPVLVAAPKQEICSVPLKNALRPGPLPPIRQFRPDSGRRMMPEVQVPAPSCDDVGRK